MDLYQSLVTVNPVTLIAQICNLFIQLFLAKKFFLDKVKAILDQRREAADKEITDAKAAHAEAEVIKQTYEQNMKEARAKADDLLLNAQRTANSRSEETWEWARLVQSQDSDRGYLETSSRSDMWGSPRHRDSSVLMIWRPWVTTVPS